MTPFSSDQLKDATRHAWDTSASGWNRQTPVIHNWLSDATAVLLHAAAKFQTPDGWEGPNELLMVAGEKPAG